VKVLEQPQGAAGSPFDEHGQTAVMTEMGAGQRAVCLHCGVPWIDVLRGRPRTPPKYKVGQRVRVVLILDDVTNKGLIGLIGTITGVEDNTVPRQCGDCNGAGCPDCTFGEVLVRLQVNYDVAADPHGSPGAGTHYMHEEELEPIGDKCIVCDKLVLHGSGAQHMGPLLPAIHGGECIRAASAVVHLHPSPEGLRQHFAAKRRAS